MNVKVEAGLRWLRARPNKAFAVCEIEEGAKLDYNTLASPFNRLVKLGKGGIVRADATYGISKRVYRGFMYIGE